MSAVTQSRVVAVSHPCDAPALAAFSAVQGAWTQMPDGATLRAFIVLSLASGDSVFFVSHSEHRSPRYLRATRGAVDLVEELSGLYFAGEVRYSQDAAAQREKEHVLYRERQERNAKMATAFTLGGRVRLTRPE